MTRILRIIKFRLQKRCKTTLYYSYRKIISWYSRRTTFPLLWWEPCSISMKTSYNTCYPPSRSHALNRWNIRGFAGLFYFRSTFLFRKWVEGISALCPRTSFHCGKSNNLTIRSRHRQFLFQRFLIIAWFFSNFFFGPRKITLQT